MAVVGYNIYKNEVKQNVSVVTDLTFAITNLASNTNIDDITIKSVDDGGLESSPQSLASFLTKPAQVQGLTATADSDSQITLNWNSILGDGAFTYTVYRGTTTGALSIIEINVATNSYIDTGLTPETQYFYAVLAANATGDGALSVEANATTQAALSPDTSVNGEQAFLVIGDSIFQGSNNLTGPGPTPASGTAFYHDDSDNTIKEIGSTDLPNAQEGSPWPQFCIDYNESTGLKPVIIPRGLGGSKFQNWQSGAANYDNAKQAAIDTMTLLGVTKLKYIFISLGINDRTDSLPLIQTSVDGLIASLKIDFPDTEIGISMPGYASTLEQQIPKIRGILKEKAIAETKVNILNQFENIWKWGLYGADEIHPIQEGNNLIGTQICRYITSNSSHNKFSKSVYSSLFTNLSSTKKDAINTFITSQIANNSYQNMVSFYNYIAPDRKDVLSDWGLLNSLQDESFTFEANSHIKTEGVVNTTATMLVSFNNNDYRFSINDIVVGVKIKSFTAPTGATSYLFGNFQSPSAVFGLTRNASGILNGYASDLSSGLTTTGGYINNVIHSVGRIGTTKYLNIDGVEIDTETGITANTMFTGGFGIGYRKGSSNFGFVTCEYENSFVGLQSAINQLDLKNDLDVLNPILAAV